MPFIGPSRGEIEMTEVARMIARRIQAKTTATVLCGNLAKRLRTRSYALRRRLIGSVANGC